MTSAISEQQFASGFLHLLHTNTPVFSATHTTSQSRGPVTLTKMPAPKRKRTDAGLGSSADAAAAAGIKAVIQPGGSMRDAEVIAAADEHGLAMVFTGVRHFRH